MSRPSLMATDLDTFVATMSDMASTSIKLALTPGALTHDDIERLLARYAKIEKIIARVRPALEACAQRKTS